MGSRINFLQPVSAIVAEAAQATRVVLTFDCEITLEVDDLVYQDPITANKVLENIDNAQIQPTIGVVLEKTTTTECKVLVLGLHDAFTGLTIGNRTYLGTDGAPTSTRPLTDYEQNLGISVSPTTIFFMPNTQRIYRP